MVSQSVKLINELIVKAGEELNLKRAGVIVVFTEQSHPEHDTKKEMKIAHVSIGSECVGGNDYYWTIP